MLFAAPRSAMSHSVELHQLSLQLYKLIVDLMNVATAPFLSAVNKRDLLLRNMFFKSCDISDSNYYQVP